MFKHINYFRFPLILIALGIIGLTSCSREADPRSDIEARYAALRFDSTMSAEEYQYTSDLVHHPVAAPEGTTAAPRIQGATSNRVYNLTYSPYVTVTVGGATYNHTIAEWQGGVLAGNVSYAPVIDSLLKNLSKKVRINIGDNPIPWWYEFPLRPITFTQIDRGNYVLSGGIYTTATNNYLYLGGGNGVGGQVGTTSCGAITYGNLNGYIAPGYGSTSGFLSYNVIAACLPVVVAASIQFSFTGVAQP
jgi:hypothetical protein